MENSIKKLGNQNFNNICTELEDNLFQTVRNQLMENNLEVIEEEIGEMVNDVLRAVYYQE